MTELRLNLRHKPVLVPSPHRPSHWTWFSRSSDFITAEFELWTL